MDDKKNENVISEEEYFMGMALLSSLRSKDPSTQVGACIMSTDNRVLSCGYNGTPKYISDDDFNWSREGSYTESKYAFVVHAEPNAIINFKGYRNELKDSTIYVTLFPCNECAKIIVQSDIKEVVYLEDKYAETDSVIVAKMLFDANGVVYRQYDGEMSLFTGLKELVKIRK